MARGLPYDSDEGRSLRRRDHGAHDRPRLPQVGGDRRGGSGPFAGYQPNAGAMIGVMRMHRASVGNIDRPGLVPETCSTPPAARVGRGARPGRGARLPQRAGDGAGADRLPRRRQPRLDQPRARPAAARSGDPVGPKWQDLDLEVATDEGPRQATKFYVNGFEQVVSIETGRGYRIQGTPTHRIKVVDADGDWVWRRFAEIQTGDRVPLMLNGLVGEPVRTSLLPPLGELHWTPTSARGCRGR